MYDVECMEWHGFFFLLRSLWSSLSLFSLLHLRSALNPTPSHPFSLLFRIGQRAPAYTIHTKISVSIVCVFHFVSGIHAEIVLVLYHHRHLRTELNGLLFTLANRSRLYCTPISLYVYQLFIYFCFNVLSHFCLRNTNWCVVWLHIFGLLLTKV